jgi:beta-galactosidase/beta-glucuronidase
MTARLHPRPLLARREWLDLDGEWEFAFDDDDTGLRARWQDGTEPLERRVIVPFPPESLASGVGETGHPVLWYRRSLPLRSLQAGRRAVLHFDAVDWAADVWVNGVHVVSHLGGHVGFAADITHALVDGEQQVVVVRVFDDATSLEQPRGKQDWEPDPHVIWYHRTSGIWRQVWIEVVSEIHLQSLIWTPLAEPGSVHVEARISGMGGRGDVALDLQFAVAGEPIGGARFSVHDGLVSTAFELSDARFDTEPDRLMWSPDSPHLIDVAATVRVGAEAVDTATSYLGLRTVGTDTTHILLNGRPLFLRMVLEQAYWPDSHLAAPSDDALRREVELIKSLGFNGLRMHQTTADPRFLYWCDRLGLLVWADAPATYRFSRLSLTNTVREWTEIVARDSSNPSVIAWVAFNESWGVPDLATSARQQDAVLALVHLLRALDPSRLVIGNDGWEFVGGDFIGVHDYTQSADLIDERYGTPDAAARTVRGGRPGGRMLAVPGALDGEGLLPVVLSEFGGTSYSPDDESWAGYGEVDSATGLLSRIGGLMRVVHAASGLAGFCYTQLTDTLQEKNGLLTADRRPKFDDREMRAVFAGVSLAAGGAEYG